MMGEEGRVLTRQLRPCCGSGEIADRGQAVGQIFTATRCIVD